MRFNHQNRFYLRITKKDVDELFNLFPEALNGHRTYFVDVCKQMQSVVKILGFIKQLNAKHGTRFFDQVTPTKEKLNQIRPSDNQVIRNLADLRNEVLNSLRKRQPDQDETQDEIKDKIKAILGKCGIYF